MKNDVHSVLISVGESMLVLPAPSLVAVINPQAMIAASRRQPELLGSVNGEQGVVPVVAGESLIGKPPQPINSRCRIALVRQPGSRHAIGILARSYPLVVSLNDKAFTEPRTPPPLPKEGLLGFGLVGRRLVCLPNLGFWVPRAHRWLAAERPGAVKSVPPGQDAKPA